MKSRFYLFLGMILAPMVAFAANEGVPSYYQTSSGPNANQIGYGQYSKQGYSKYVGSSGQSQVVGTRTTTYQVPVPPPAPAVPTVYGTMTPNGVATAPDKERGTSLYGDYTRRFADFEFKTGVNSVLEWDDMVFNELTVGARHNFSLRDFDLFAYGQYTYGKMEHGGLSMDYDLEPYDPTYYNEGIFTISMGGQDGHSNHLKFGIGAHHIWDIAGWKLSPSIGYEIFKHNLKMFDHYYPNPGIYLPLLTVNGDYVYGDAAGNYYVFPQDSIPPDDLYQVCMSPEDIKLVNTSVIAPGGGAYLGTGSDSLPTVDYDPSMGYSPWGVAPGDCVIIGGDGPIIAEGTTHVYNTTWSGFFVGLEIEKQMTLADKLRFYVQFGLPKYSSDGIWPMRDDWQQNPSFVDEGSNGAYSYTAEMEYNLRLSERLQLALKVDTNYFHVGNIGGKLYIAEYTDIAYDNEGNPIWTEETVCDPLNPANCQTIIVPELEIVPAHTEDISDSLKRAIWQSFGLHVGFKFAF